jgi:hypothetical protein
LAAALGGPGGGRTATGAFEGPPKGGGDEDVLMADVDDGADLAIPPP